MLNLKTYIAQVICIALVSSVGTFASGQSVKARIDGMSTECDFFARPGGSKKFSLMNCRNPEAGIALLEESEKLLKKSGAKQIKVHSSDGKTLVCKVLSVDLLFGTNTPNPRGPWGVLCETIAQL